MAAKNILFLHKGGFWNRGSEKVLLRSLEGLDREQFNPLLVCNHKLFSAEAEKLGIKTLLKDWPEVMIENDHIRLQFIGVIKTIFWLKKLIQKESIDLLVCNGGLTTQTGYFAAKLTKIPCLSYIHSPFNKRYIYLYGLHKSDQAVFVSNAIKTMVTDKVTFGKTVVIHNGIDIEFFKPVTTRDRGIVKGMSLVDGTPVIGQIGSLIHRKGIDLLIAAAKMLRDKNIKFHIILVGGGSEENRLKEMVSESDLNNFITFAGDTDSPDLFYKHLFDINVLCSRSEAFGLTLAEGAACGLPCVGSNVEGIPEVISDQKTGLLFESGNASDLVEKLEILLSDNKLRKKMGEEGRRFVMDNLSLTEQVNEFNKTLVNLVSAHG